MSVRLMRDLERVPCPHCPDGPGLALALRLELETESELYFASCTICNRLYEVSPGGDLRFETSERRALIWREVKCPRCRAVGYAVSYALPAAAAESHIVLTCRECQHTFCPEEEGGQSGTGGAEAGGGASGGARPAARRGSSRRPLSPGGRRAWAAVPALPAAGWPGIA